MVLINFFWAVFLVFLYTFLSPKHCYIQNLACLCLFVYSVVASDWHIYLQYNRTYDKENNLDGVLSLAFP